jgi:histone H3/H4
MAGEILVVASKVKAFIREKSGCNTSAETIEALSKVLEQLLSTSIENAKAQGRKTVMARDVTLPGQAPTAG